MTPQKAATTKASAIRRIADAMDAGAPDPISITMWPAVPQLLAHGQDQWKAWVAHLGGRPSDGVLVDHFPGKHQPSVVWNDGQVQVEYLEAMTEVVEPN